MNKVKTLAYWILFIIYEEIVFSILIFDKFPSSLLWFILLSTPFAIFLDMLTSIFKKKVINTVLAYILTIATCFIV